MTRLALVAALLLPLVHLDAQAADLVVANARVIDVRTGRVASGRSIVTRGDTILAITDRAGAARFRAAHLVDAGNRFAIPGLWDMHVHFGGGDTLIAENRSLLPLYPAHGVVAVRDAAGDLPASVLAWRDSIASGTLVRSWSSTTT